MVTIHILTLISLLFCNTGARGCSIAQISAITTTVAIIVCAVFIDILNAITIHVGIANITEAVIVRILTFFRATIVTPVRVGIATHQCIEGIQVIVIDHAIIIVVVIAIVWGAISVCVHIVVISFAYVRIAADAVTVRIVKCIVRALVATVWGAIYVCVHIVVMPVALVHIVADAITVVVGGGATAFACTVYGTETYVCPICGALRITFNSICSALNSITQIPTRM